jgi:hypothetical protein
MQARQCQQHQHAAIYSNGGMPPLIAGSTVSIVAIVPCNAEAMKTQKCYHLDNFVTVFL